MSAAPRFSLRAAVTDNVSTGRRDEVPTDIEPTLPSESAVTTAPETSRPANAAQAKRPATRQGTRGITVWVEPEVYRMIKLIGLDADMTTQSVMMEAINDLFAKKGKGRIVKSE